jgi:hypothetical protein
MIFIFVVYHGKEKAAKKKSRFSQASGTQLFPFSSPTLMISCCEQTPSPLTRRETIHFAESALLYASSLSTERRSGEKVG